MEVLSKIPQHDFKEKDFEVMAEDLGCEINAIKAVAIVESSGKDFFVEIDGKIEPVILWERHKFYKYTDKPYSKTHPHLSNKKAGGYSKGRNTEERQEKEWAKFKEGYSLEPVAAVMSCSWGAFQIMGFNHRRVGFTNTEDFLAAMRRGVREHLYAFSKFIKADPNLLDAIRTKNWKRFAFLYNGEEFWRHQYDKKMADAYKLLSSPKN